MGEARRRRAEHIHKQIDRLSQAPGEEAEEEKTDVQRRDAPKVRPSPREFIHKRMQELDEAQADKDSGEDEN